MTEPLDDNVVNFAAAAPSLKFVQREPGDPRRFCDHRKIEVWQDEPIIKCTKCHATVDPYRWIRDRCTDYRRLHEAETFRINDAKQELAELTIALRLLRREYADEAEKRRAERQLMVMPPRRRV